MSVRPYLDERAAASAALHLTSGYVERDYVNGQCRHGQQSHEGKRDEHYGLALLP